MIEYKSIDKIYLKGRGYVFMVKNDKDRCRDNNDLIGTYVLIDGIKYKVKGVESFAINKIHEGWPIGILVDDENITNLK